MTALTAFRREDFILDDANALVQEASTLGLAPGVVLPEFVVLFSDAWPGTYLRYRYASIDYGPALDVAGWRYVQTEHSGRPATVVVIND